ncbi:hypothetical protein ACGFZH_21045 [Streptomyces zaomyceticus]|uniref:hypothetical protein n=1 Tax=Streptomyces zaomyceticus TaxID=68286 RepID=UPI003718D0CB
MICRTPEEAFAAGLDEACEHDVPPAACELCQLSEPEITRLVVLYRDHLPPTAASSEAA